MLRTGLSKKPRAFSIARSRQAVPLAGAEMGRSSLRSDCPALLALGAHGTTRYVRCAHCAQTRAVSQRWKRAGARRPQDCAARRPMTAPARGTACRSGTTEVLGVENRPRLCKGLPSTGPGALGCAIGNTGSLRTAYPANARNGPRQFLPHLPAAKKPGHQVVRERHLFCEGAVDRYRREASQMLGRIIAAPTAWYQPGCSPSSSQASPAPYTGDRYSIIAVREAPSSRCSNECAP
jgi:hypothetical protein